MSARRIYDGGPAHPVAEYLIPGSFTKCPHYGMSLRDYFAANAMPVIYERVESGGFDRVARLSYEMADAMLKAREAKS